MTAPHTVTPHTVGVADHAAPSSPPDPAVVAKYAAALLPAVLWLLGVYLFDGDEVPLPLQGTVALLVTGACSALVRWAHRG